MILFVDVQLLGRHAGKDGFYIPVFLLFL